MSRERKRRVIGQFERDSYQGMPSGMPKSKPLTGFSHCEYGVGPQRLKPLLFLALGGIAEAMP